MLLVTATGAIPTVDLSWTPSRRLATIYRVCRPAARPVDAMDVEIVEPSTSVAVTPARGSRMTQKIRSVRGRRPDLRHLLGNRSNDEHVAHEQNLGGVERLAELHAQLVQKGANGFGLPAVMVCVNVLFHHSRRWRRFGSRRRRLES